MTDYHTTQKPVLFWDFHGTLTLPEVTWYDVALEAAAEQVPDRPLTTELLDEHLAFACLPWFEIESRDVSHLTDPEDWWAYCEANFVTMLMKCGFTRAEARRTAPKIRTKTLEAHRYHLFPDAACTLQQLQQRGYRSYILSNNFPELEQLVADLELASCFEGVFTSARVGYDKPRPEIFEAAGRVLHPGETAWMIGDNPLDDVAGGNAAGFVTAAVHNVDAPEATHRVDDLSELLTLLP